MADIGPTTRLLRAGTIALCWLSIGLSQARAEYEIPWYVFASGGGTSGNGSYQVTGTVGHANDAESIGGGYTQGEGFWRNGELCFGPTGAPGLSVNRTGSVLELSWNSITGATIYDVVRGDLAKLRSTAGNFSAATDGCIADGTPTTTVVEPTATGERYFLVRPLACSPGTYDSSGVAQSNARDPGIGAAPAACP